MKPCPGSGRPANPSGKPRRSTRTVCPECRQHVETTSGGKLLRKHRTRR